MSKAGPNPNQIISANPCRHILLKVLSNHLKPGLFFLILKKSASRGPQSWHFQDSKPSHPVAIVPRIPFPVLANIIKWWFLRKRCVHIQFKKRPCIIIQMLSQETILQTAENRRSERECIALQHILSRIDFSDYQSLIEWVFQISNVLNLLPNTKFLARCYFDRTLASYQDIPVSSYLTVFIGCLSLAVKFNELRSVSDRLTPEVLLSSAGISITRDEYFSLEMRILSAIRFRFKYTTPYDYINAYLARFPFMPKLKLIIPTIIEFALLQPQACQFTSEEIFYGAVLSIFANQRIVLNDFQRNVFGRLTDCWGNAELMSGLIVTGVDRYGSQQSSN